MRVTALRGGRAAFSAYLTLCGHVRLGTAPETGGELRGCVSVQPSDRVTFSLDTASLPPVRLTDRLWKLAAEGPEDADSAPGQSERKEEKEAKGEEAEGGGEDKENEENVA